MEFRADRLTDKAAIIYGLSLGRSEVLRSFRHYLRAQSHGHHTLDRLEERGVERGTGEGVGALNDISREDGQEKATVI